MQRGHSPQTACSEHSLTWLQRGDPGLPSTLFPKPASGWVDGGLVRDVGQAWDAGDSSAGWGPGCGRLTGCAQLCPRHMPPAPPALLVNCPLRSPDSSEALNPALDVSEKWKSHHAAVPPWLLESF